MVFLIKNILEGIFFSRTDIKNANNLLKNVPFVICCRENPGINAHGWENETIPIFPGLSLVFLELKAQSASPGDQRAILGTSN